MEEIIRINLDNEMDLIIVHKRTMRLVELCGLSIAAQTTFATAVSEVARIAISYGDKSYISLNINALRLNQKEIVAVIHDKVDLKAINPEAFSYARRLLGDIQTDYKDYFHTTTLTYRVQYGGILSKAKIESFKEYFRNEPSISAYDEIRKKNIQLLELIDKLGESENRYRMLSDNLPLMMFVINNDGKISYTNKWLKEFIESQGLIPTNISWFSLLHQPDYRGFYADWEKAIINKTIFKAQGRLKQKENLIWHLISMMPVKNDNDLVTNWIGFFVDIHAQKVVEETLRDNKALKLVQQELLAHQKELEVKNTTLSRQNDFIETVLDSSVDYIMAIDADLRIITFNHSYEVLSGKKRDEVLGEKITDIFPVIKENGTYEAIKETLNGTPVHKPVHQSPLTHRFYEVFYIPLSDDTEETYGAVILGRDITDQMQHELKLKTMNEELLLRNNELEQFAYIASHDLQEPLRKIKTFSKLLNESLEMNDKQRDYFNRIINSSTRMSNLIKDVLDYSRLSRTDEQFVAVDLNEVLNIVKIDFELLIEEKGAVINSDILPVVPGIQLQLTQLFFNLLSNALKFSIQQPVIDITCRKLTFDEVNSIIELDANRGYYLINFRDNGIGFEQQFARQIFTIFQRLNDKHSYAGTGIGLALCKKIVENHNGHIFATSELGTGAVFHIYLPASVE
ncbi:ATP-binding protein [Emticicia sp. BO119]|uniref:PAS domain-containing sensor histidine kinase n=1 Tax=Emticicia sp. BO119 TaxID=2757768 RepID=UPI0015F091E9|nr:ATP-binding protein [Emticicia sp. BO119]MBA4853821.1 PAS domain-containing protein [Emticicia sp. BO119]